MDLVLLFSIVSTWCTILEYSTADAGLGLEVRGGSKEVVKEIPIRGVSLAVRLANKVVTPDRIVIANFNLSGRINYPICSFCVFYVPGMQVHYRLFIWTWTHSMSGL